MHQTLIELEMLLKDCPGDNVVDKVKGMKAIVDKLPKTADGVPVVLGDYVFSPSGRKHHVLNTGNLNPESWYVPECFNDVHGDWHDALVKDCYSTRAAAEQAVKG